MVYKRFRIQVVLRVIALTISLAVLFYLFQTNQYNITTMILGVLVILQVVSLIAYAERTNRKLAKFLQSIRHADFVSSFSDHNMGKSFEELSHEFNAVINEFKKSRAEKEEHFNYLQTVVQHVSIGMIAFRRDGKIDMFNNAVKRLFKVNNLRNIYELEKISEEFPARLLKLRAGDKTLIKVFVENEFLQLSISATEFRLRGEEYILISLQDIHTELEEKEIESWQKLIRVLTHEIMNSITPISSLANTVKELLLDQLEDEIKLKELDSEDLESVEGALRTIENRSKGLLNFVEIYRNLTRIPKPNFRYFEVKDLFERSRDLLKPKMDQVGIRCEYKVYPEDLKITADPDLIDQVIINLMLNAIDAVKEQPHPSINIITSSAPNGRVNIDFADNGTGIKPDILDKIFMPFFTSKKHGSGIGLSLSRQIMHLHKGSISVKSKPGEGTVFTLTF